MLAGAVTFGATNVVADALPRYVAILPVVLVSALALLAYLLCAFRVVPRAADVRAAAARLRA